MGLIRNGIRRSAVVTGLILSFMLISACGGGADAPNNSAAKPGETDAKSTQPAGPEKKEVKVGLPVQATTFLPVYLADSKGFFKEEGLDVKLFDFKGDAGAVQALAGNSVDLNVASLTGLVTSINSGQPFIAFWGGFNHADFDWYSTKLDSLTDAKGAKFGITTYGALTDFLTRYALSKAGLDPGKDVQILQVGGSPSALAAMESGQLDAAILSAPSKYVAEDNGMKHLLSERKDITPTWPKHVIYSKNDFLQSNPETIKAFIRAMNKGLDYMEQNQDDAAEELIKRLQFDKKYALRAVREVLPDFDRNGKIDQKGLDIFWEISIQAGDAKEPWKNEKWLDSRLMDSSNEWLK